MNASSCTGIVHDGIVEIFACSRWYYIDDTKYNNDCKNTGKSGAMFHYVATIENAKNDNFTNDGVIVYSQGRNGANAGEFHSPCLAIDDNGNGLIVHMDKGENVTCNQRFIRCNLKNLNSLAKNGSKSPAKPYSAKYTEIIFQNMLDKINTLQYALSQIEGSGVNPPSGTLLWTKTYNANDAGVHIADSSQAISPFISTSTQGTNEYTQDSNGDYYSQSYQLAINMEVTKTNCAIYIDMSTISGKISGAFGVCIGILKNGVLHALPLIDNYGTLFDENRHTVKLILDNDKYSLEIDGVDSISKLKEITDFTANTCSLAISRFKSEFSLDEVPSTGTYIIVFPSQNYLAFYDVKLGEWD